MQRQMIEQFEKFRKTSENSHEHIYKMNFVINYQWHNWDQKDNIKWLKESLNREK